jgi:prepilin-type N-terminal cleavage/methylation domain-containing protein
LRRSKKPEGFSLIEVLIALVILSISLLALAGLMATTTKNNSYGGHLTEAVTFAQQRLEQFRVTPYASVSTSPTPVIQTGVPSGIPYSLNWVVAPNAGDTLRRITITVDWNDGIAHSFSIVTVVKNPTSGI